MGLLTRTDHGAQTQVNNSSKPVQAAVRALQPTLDRRSVFGRDVAANVGIVDKRKQFGPKALSGASEMPAVQVARGTGGQPSVSFFGAVTDAGIVGKRVNDKSKAMPQTPAMAGASALLAQNSQKVSYYGATASARAQLEVSSGDDMPITKKLELLRVSVLSVKEKEAVVVKSNGKEFAITKYHDNNGKAWVKVDKKSNSEREKNDFEKYLQDNKVYLIDVVDNLQASDVNDTSEDSWLDRFRSAFSW